MARILVLQEIQENVSRVRKSLEPAGHEILPFASKAKAIQFLRKDRVDMIISAIHLVDGNVFDFLLSVKRDPRNATAPFIFFCAEPTVFSKHVSSGVRTAAQVLGASRYIMMERFDSIDFRHQISELLSESRIVQYNRALQNSPNAS
jgi:CheY-like chemotaxis protein